MIDNDLLKKINSQNAAEIFSRLYGESEVNAARQRYTALITEILKDDFPETESGVKKGNLRLFSAPGRTELAGNHTDHNCGKVLAASIQLDSIAIVQERNDNTVFFRSAGFPDVKINLTNSNGDPDLQPKAEEKEKTAALIRGIAAEFHKRGCAVKGFSANVKSDVLAGSGLSSSASIEVLIGCIFNSLFNKGKFTALEIAQIGQIAENVYFGKPCGLMDQTACAAGGAVAIDFKSVTHPVVKQINFDLTSAGYTLCIVNTGGDHADLTSDYASIPAEMKAAAAFFGKTLLRELTKETVLNRAAEVRKTLGDRALLRSIHFFDDNERVDVMADALIKMADAPSSAVKQNVLNQYLDLVNESGDSSWKILQNVYSPNNPASQGISVALALTKDFFRRQKPGGSKAACRVHGGGFAGTIQTYIPIDLMETYFSCIEAVFGKGSITPLMIRQKGALELVF